MDHGENVAMDGYAASACSVGYIYALATASDDQRVVAWARKVA
jgi:hypothetical protein